MIMQINILMFKLKQKKIIFLIRIFILLLFCNYNCLFLEIKK